MRCTDIVSKIKSVYLGSKMAVWLIVGVVGGIVLGTVLYLVNQSVYTSRQVMYVGYLGTLFIQALTALSFPLMGTCLICAFATMDKVVSKRIGLQFGLFLVLTKLEAAFLGLIMAVIVQPGAGLNISVDEDQYLGEFRKVTAMDSIMDTIRNVFPLNVVQMALKHYRTVLIPDNNTNPYDWEVQSGGEMVFGPNALGLISISIILGFAVNKAQEGGRAVFDLVKCINIVTFTVTTWIMLCSPVCFASLLAAEIMQLSVAIIVRKVGLYLLAICVSEMIQFLIVYPIIHFLMVRRNPFILYKHAFTAMMAAFVTDSSMATVAFTINCMEEKANIDKRFVRWVIPVAHTINRDGTAIFLAYSIVYVSQLHEHALTFGQYVLTVVLSSLGSFAMSAGPFPAIVVLIALLQSIPLPIPDMYFIMLVDWIVDRFRTLVNCTGDLIILEIVHKYNKHEETVH